MNSSPTTGQSHQGWMKSGNLWRWFLLPVLLQILAGLPFWVLGTKYYLMRPIFNLDVLLALMLGAFSWQLAVVALLVSWGIDGLYGVSLSYHFQSLNEFVRSFQFAGHLDFFRMLKVTQLWLALPFVAALSGIAYLMRAHKVSIGAIFLSMAILALADAGNGSSRLSTERKDAWLISSNIAGSVALSIGMPWFKQFSGEPVGLRSIATDAQSVEPEAWAKAHPAGSILMVVIESLGLHTDSTLLHWLERQWMSGDIRRRWHVIADQVSFRGSTTDGELRSLCHLSGHYGLLNTEWAKKCLPQRLKSIGFDSIGYHGFSGDMFNRKTWWKTAGFSQMVLAEDVGPEAPRCGGVFRGVCDTYLAERAVASLSNGRRFVYLLTLNTHLPLEPGSVPTDLASICSHAQIGPGVCQLTAQHGAFLRHLSTLLSSSTNSPLVVLVGDHAPPFAVSTDRNRFSPDKVARYTLVPNDAEHGSVSADAASPN